MYIYIYIGLEMSRLMMTYVVELYKSPSYNFARTSRHAVVDQYSALGLEAWLGLV